MSIPRAEARPILRELPPICSTPWHVQGSTSVPLEKTQPILPYPLLSISSRLSVPLWFLLWEVAACGTQVTAPPQLSMVIPTAHVLCAVVLGSLAAPLGVLHPCLGPWPQRHCENGKSPTLLVLEAPSLEAPGVLPPSDTTCWHQWPPSWAAEQTWDNARGAGTAK